MEIQIPITYESSDVNKLFETYLEKAQISDIKHIESKNLLFDIFKMFLKTKGKIEFKGKYIFQLTKGE